MFHDCWMNNLFGESVLSVEKYLGPKTLPMKIGMYTATECCLVSQISKLWWKYPRMTFLKSSCPTLIKDAWESVRLRSTYPIYAQKGQLWVVGTNGSGRFPWTRKLRAILSMQSAGSSEGGQYAASTFPSCCLGCCFNVDKACAVTCAVTQAHGLWLETDRWANTHPSLPVGFEILRIPKNSACRI